MNINVVVSDGEIIPIQVDKDKDTLNDLFSKLNEKRTNKITVTLVTINGMPVKPEEFSKSLNNWELEDGYAITISEYYDGGIFF